MSVTKKLPEIEAQAKTVAEKIKYLNSEIAIKYLEENLMGIKKEMEQLESKKTSKKIPTLI